MKAARLLPEEIVLREAGIAVDVHLDAEVGVAQAADAGGPVAADVVPAVVVVAGGDVSRGFQLRK